MDIEQNCNNCKNKDLCRWCDEMVRNQKAVDEIPICKGMCPVMVTVTCNKFQRINLKEDGFMNSLDYKF